MLVGRGTRAEGWVMKSWYSTCIRPLLNNAQCSNSDLIQRRAAPIPLLELEVSERVWRVLKDTSFSMLDFMRDEDIWETIFSTSGFFFNCSWEEHRPMMKREASNTMQDRIIGDHSISILSSPQ